MTTKLETAIQPLAHDYLANAHGAGIAESKIKELLLNWKYDYAAWEKVREAFVSQKPLDMTSNTANAQWARLVRSFGLKKPQSKSADAITKAANREKQIEKMKAFDDATLAKKIQLLTDNGLDAKTFKAEQKRRQAEKDAPIKEAKDKALAEIKAALPKADLKTLKKIHTLLKLA